VVQVKDLTDLTLEDLWREVKYGDEDWWEEFEETQLRIVKTVLESSLEEELLMELGAGRYKRTRSRRNYRNGHYERSFATKYGVIKALRIPRARESYQSQIVPRYQRRQQQVHEMIREMFLSGVSTRRVGEVLSTVGGENVSPQTVSRVLRSLGPIQSLGDGSFTMAASGRPPRPVPASYSTSWPSLREEYSRP
jgi:transposase-like protein